MDNVLVDLKWNIYLCNLDNIIVNTPNFQEHIIRLKMALKGIQEMGLTLSSDKCSFGKKKLMMLVHLVNQHGIYPDPQKKLLASGPVLGHFLLNATKKSDSSGYSISAVLVQVQGGKERPIAYASTSLTAAENNYSTIEKFIAVIRRRQVYTIPLRKTTTIVTDHHSLC
ncbi:transposon Ty3-I Gag-Pol polyprotein [Trichonephila clavata]|uniref:Transposon Ty3-I Gag-Pol polyprotein n=1 Tax=Trichonephila clavata TaxID=2740835 RepID=A0A8X6KMS4_TRICU|nr:transposon Ty3-I Gag-Pol polyprotein [Trichonephila clavata]